MKSNINYTNDPRWERCSDDHKRHGICPNWFITALLQLNSSALKDINIAIETGTFEGHTTEFFAQAFDKVYTVEKFITHNYYTSQNLAEVYSEMKKQYNNIDFYNGDSPEFLANILRDIDEPCVILLDAHNGASSPVRQELIAIKKHLKCVNSVIMIDDTLDAGSGDWPTMQELRELLLDINSEFKFKTCNFGRQILVCYE
jgi:hypothetical protein